MNLLSLNLALRPPLSTPCECETDYHVYNAHEPRVRGFIEFLKQQTPQPEVLVFQEVMWFPTAELLSGELSKLGYSTHENIDPLNPMNRGSIDPTTKTPIAPSGLAIYVRDSSMFEILDSQRFVFDVRIGMDQLAQKGFAWLKLQHKLTKQMTVVITLHPQAYLTIDPQSPACEHASFGKLRQLAQLQASKFAQTSPFAPGLTGVDMWRKAIEQVHLLQFQQIQSEVAKLESKEPDLQFVMIGDFNVNRYTPLPWTKDEQSWNHAIANTQKLGQEYIELLKIMKGFQALPVCHDSPSFSWDTKHNSFASGLVGEPHTFQRIDSCWIKGWRKSFFLQQCEAVNPIRISPTPELSPLWFASCQQANSKIKATLNARLQLGAQQLEQALKKFLGSEKFRQLQNPWVAAQANPKWKVFLQHEPKKFTSQLWLGLDGYGLLRDDDWGVEAFRKRAETQAIGQPHGYRMISDASDHHALVVYL